VRVLLGAVVLGWAAAAVPSHAQRVQPPVRRDSLPRTRAGADSVRRAAGRDSSQAGPDYAAVDSTAPKVLVKWAESDPVIDSLLARKGYNVTRFQGRRITFDANSKILTLIRDDSARAAIGRDQTIMVSDTIVYNDSTKVVRARGAENVLRDPARGGDDVVSRGTMYYNTTERRGTVGYVKTTIESGQKYFVDAQSAGFANDSTGEEAAFFGRRGTITTCDDSIPHYHISSRELKMVKGKLAVGRPGVLYIYDVPVMWLPFFFQDARRGRRSGILSPRLGFSEVVRNAPLYRRTIENLGYYYNLGDYQDIQGWVDWRSSANIDPLNSNDFGFVRYNLQWRYNWLRRFLSGSIGSSYQRFSNGNTNLNIQFSHQQRFSRKTNFTANVNYMSNTTAQRVAAFNAFAATATFRSGVNYTTQIGKFNVGLGANQTQYTGRPQRDLTLPTLSVTTAPISVGNWLTWTPTFNASETRNLNQQAAGQGTWRYTSPSDSSQISLNNRASVITINTPLQLFGFNIDAGFDVNDRANTGLQQKTVEQIIDRGNGVVDTVQAIRFFDGFTESRADWRIGFSLPAFSRGKWNLTPSLQFANVDQGAFWVRSSLNGGRWVAQSKRPSLGLSISPTLFGFFPGIGPVRRIRHSISPVLAWSVAPRATVNREYLLASNTFSRGYNGALPQNMLSLSLTQNVEVKLKSNSTSPDSIDAGRKVRALSIQTDGLSYNFLQYQEIRRRAADPSRVSRFAGLTSSSWGMGLRSDFLPGFDFATRFSLFQGNPISDTAVFKPFREEIRMSLRLDRTTGVIQWFNRLLGGGEFKPAPSNLTATDSLQLRNDQNSLQGVNRGLNGNQVRPGFGVIPSGQGWNVNLSYSSTRQRPPIGPNFIQLPPLAERCANFLGPAAIANPFALQQCIASNGQFGGVDNNAGTIGAGSPIIINPPIQSLQIQTSFNLTPKWATQWSTTYDAVRKEFAAQTVSLQRELHDWRAIFNFTQAPNGNFAFSFFIALKAQPDLKFNFDQQSFRRPDGSR
jgi:hypothetical protein